MRIPVLRGVIDRRILVNFRVDPRALERVLPAPFRPQLVRGFGIGGICLIRLKDLRARWIPRVAGLSSENAAHRIAVTWDEGGATRSGVYIPRRDTSSILNALAGGRLFPGEHHRARFEVSEAGGVYQVAATSHDGGMHVAIDAKLASALPEGSAFGSLEEASAFFRGGSVGYSETSRPGELDGLELRTRRWELEPLEARQVASSFFSDTERFPAGTVELDSAFLMRDIEHEWHGRELLRCA